METYHKINALFKRHMSGPHKGKLIKGQWSLPEFEYLSCNLWEYTEKVDGTNIRVGERLGNLHFLGRSDNADIPPLLLEYLKDTFTWQSFRDVFADVALTEVTLFGEGYGPKIQGGGKYRGDHSFVLFDVKIGDWWLQRKDVEDIANKLGIDSVPVIGTGTLQDAIDIVTSGLTWDKYGKMTQWGGAGVAGLRSKWGNFEAEGIVARPTVALFTRRGDRIITKIKAIDFK